MTTLNPKEDGEEALDELIFERDKKKSKYDEQLAEDEDDGNN
jgi:hypothetical protein